MAEGQLIYSCYKVKDTVGFDGSKPEINPHLTTTDLEELKAHQVEVISSGDKAHHTLVVTQKGRVGWTMHTLNTVIITDSGVSCPFMTTRNHQEE